MTEVEILNAILQRLIFISWQLTVMLGSVIGITIIMIVSDRGLK